MILSERELELGQEHGGIMLLDDSFEPGTPLSRCCRSATTCSRSRPATTAPT